MSDLIHVTVTLSGRAAEMSLDPRLEYALVPPARLGTLLELIGLKRPELGGMLPSCQCTVNGEAASPETILSEGDLVEIDSRE